MRDLGNANRANGTSAGFALRVQDIDPLRPSDQDDFFGFVTLLRPGSYPPHCHKTYLKVDQFIGGGSGGTSPWRISVIRLSNNIFSICWRKKAFGGRKS
jgi:hypothetical protein